MDFTNSLKIFAVAICLLCITLNIFSLVILKTSEKFKESRFKTLVLFLSMSDLAIGIEFLTHVILNMFADGQDSILQTCLALKHLIAGTITFSLYQTLLVCLERLNATFRPKIRLIQKLTKNKVIILSFIIIHLYSLTHLAFDLTRGVRPCTVASTSNLSFVLTMDIPISLLMFSITFVYLIVIARIVKHHKRVFNDETLSTVTKMNRNNSAVQVMRRNVFTLGAIIAITFVANIPRFVTAVYSLYSGPVDMTLKWLKISNHLLLFNPVFDPVLYVLRIQEYRDKIRCGHKNSTQTIVTSFEPSTVSTNVIRRMHTE